MQNTEEEYKASVQKSQEKAHEETMWGKPARDIVTGIGNNGGIRPVRAIWELVQNARDVVADGKRAKIVFKLKEDSVLFQHDGIPFTHKTIEALILQTSSKQSVNNVQVGQYGTGFLTTHLFGLKFQLRAPLLTSEEFSRYYEIPDFVIDRSATAPDAMMKKLKEQWLETQDWGKDFSKTTDKPTTHTTFRYIFEGKQAQLNAKSAFEQAPDMTPYVLALNANIESIKYVDEIDQTETAFMRQKADMDYVENLTDGKLYKTVVHRTITNLLTNVEEEKDFYIYCVISNEQTVDEPKRANVIAILPLTEDEDGSLRAIEFKYDLPLIYIHLPLLGTEQWGFNYMLHSSLFTCDKDSRDSLRLVGNGQNNDDQAENNRNVIALANKLICQFIDKKVNGLKDAKYLVKAAFHTQQVDKKLGDYYTELQREWVRKFETLFIVEGRNDGMYQVSAIRVLDDALVEACEKDSKLLDAIYDLFEKNNVWTVSNKADMLYWSKTINRWYREELKNPHTLTISDLVADIPDLTIEEKDLVWLHKLCSYIVESKQNALLDTYSLIPNEALQLQKKTPLLHPVTLAEEVGNVLALMVPETTEFFVHPLFYDLLTFTPYGYGRVKEQISTYVNNHNTTQNSARDQVKMYKKHDVDYPLDGRQFNVKQYEDKMLSDELVTAMLVMFKSLLPEDSEGKPAELYNLLLEFYGTEMPDKICRLDKAYDLDARTFYNSLTYDCLFRFTLSDDKESRKDWIKSMVALIYSMSDSRSYLSNYQVYPNQLGIFKYADWLKKQSANVPDRALEIYDTIIQKASDKDNSNSIKNVLLSKEYEDYFVGTNVLDGLEECSKIEGEVEKKGYSITKYDHENLIVEIIQSITSGADAAKWKALFGDLDAHKGQIMFSVIQSQTKKDSIFTIMKIKDDNKLKTIAELANEPRLDEIIKEGRKVIAQSDYEKRHDCFIHDLGNFVEKLLLEKLQGVVGDDQLKVDVTDQQGGQDYLVKLDGKVVYYVEVKSRWKTSESVEMSSLQFKTSVEEKDHYSLCYVDMTWKNIDEVGNREYDDLDTCIAHTKVLNDVGRRNERCIDSVKEAKDRTHIGGGYSLVVPQVLFDNEPSTLVIDGVQFERATDFYGLVDKIKEVIDQEMSLWSDGQVH